MRTGSRASSIVVLAAIWCLAGTARVGATTPIEEGEDAIVLEEYMEIDIRSVNSATLRFGNRTKILTKAGAEKHSIASVFYQSGVKVNSLRGSVTPPAGKPIKIKKKQIVDGTAFASYVLYSDSRHRTIHFPGVVPGAIVEYSYELSIKNLFYLPRVFQLQDVLPIRRKTLMVRAPDSFPVRLIVRGGSPDHSTEERDGVVTRRWSVENVPSLKPNRMTLPALDLVPKILIAPKEIVWGDHRIDAETWGGIGRFYWDLARDRMRPTPEVESRAKELTAGTLDPAEKTRHIYEFVQGRVNYVAISLDIGGYQPHPSGDVLKYMYGDCKDKATLMIAMLRSVDLEGFPVLIRTRDAGLFDRDTPALSFNHAIVAVPSEEGYLFMDPTSEQTPFGDLPWIDQGVPVVVVREDGKSELAETPLFPPHHNRRHITVTGRIEPDGAMEGFVTIEAWGHRKANLIPLLDARSEEREEALSSLIGWLSPGARLESQEIDPPASPADPLRVKGRLIFPRFVTRAGSIEIISPHVARFPDLTWAAAYSGRRHPLFFRYLFANTVEARLTLPAGRTLKKVPESGTIEGPGVISTTEYELVREGGRNVLIVRRSLEITRREIPVEEYDKLYAFVTALAREEARAVTLTPEI